MTQQPETLQLKSYKNCSQTYNFIGGEGDNDMAFVIFNQNNNRTVGISKQSHSL